MAENPDQWVMEDFKDWRDNGFPTSTAAYTASLACNTTTTLTRTGPVSQKKKHEDALLSWRRGKQDPTLYPILENDCDYTDWIIKMKR